MESCLTNIPPTSSQPRFCTERKLHPYSQRSLPVFHGRYLGSVAMSVGKPELIFECVAVHKLLSKATNHRVFIYSEIAQLTRELEEKEVSKFTLHLIIVNLLTLYYKCQNLIGYTTRYPFWDTQRVE